MKKNRKILIIFDIEITLKVINWHFLSADFGLLVGLTMTCFCEEILTSNICMRGFMCSAIKKSWKVCNTYVVLVFQCIPAHWSWGFSYSSIIMHPSTMLKRGPWQFFLLCIDCYPVFALLFINCIEVNITNSWKVLVKVS